MLYALCLADTTHVHDGGSGSDHNVIHSHFGLHVFAHTQHSGTSLEDYDPPAHYLDLSWVPSHSPLISPVLVSGSTTVRPLVCLGTAPATEFSISRSPPPL